MPEKLMWLNEKIYHFVWGVPALVCFIGVGAFLTWKTNGIQIRRFILAMKITLGRMLQKQEAKEGAMTPFQAVCTALAATIGTGSIAGVAGAIAIGGAGAVFWMWISALLGMGTKFAEVTLAVHFREKNAQGEWVGGPMYYIKNGLHPRWYPLAMLYAGLGALAVFGIGNTTQVNTIAVAVDAVLVQFGIALPHNLSRCNLAIGIAIAIFLGMVLLGGIRSIGSVTERLVPFMAILYFLLSTGVILAQIQTLPSVLCSIVTGAFCPQAVTGGVVGSLFLSMRKGISSGVFSNEAGMGTGSIAHACADTDSAVKQGYFGIFEVFVDTFVICTLTALVVLCSGIPIPYGETVGAELTIAGFTKTYGGWVTPLTALTLCCFAFSTLIGWGLYGVRCITFLFSEHLTRPFLLVFALAAIPGATMELQLLWNLAETMNGLMSIPNLIALLLLSSTLAQLVQEESRKG